MCLTGAVPVGRGCRSPPSPRGAASGVARTPCSLKSWRRPDRAFLADEGGSMSATRFFDIDATAFADAFARRSIAVPPQPRRPSAVHDRRHRGTRRPAAARIGATRAGQPAARELRLRVRRGRDRGRRRETITRRRAHGSADLPARHPAGARVRRADQRVPGRGRGARRRPRGRHDAAEPATCSSPARRRRRRCTSTSSTASCCR